MAALSRLGIAVPKVLLPRQGVDLKRWAVVAADQFTSQREYWERVENQVGESPSTLRLILPEAYLGDADVDARIQSIHAAMQAYERDGVFTAERECFVLVDRKTSEVPSRKGLLVALDLEQYDYTRGATTLVRATEHTVEERLPPRVRVREGASLELPHVMVLIDDPDRRVIEPLFERCAQQPPLYETELMEGGGAIRGFAVDDPDSIRSVEAGLAALADPARCASRYGTSGDVLLYAMGDGNHSLAAAKVHWGNLKRTLGETEQKHHPARHALVELVNVHDEGLVFEPIHRVVFGIAPDSLLDAMRSDFEAQGSRFGLEMLDDSGAQRARLRALWSQSEVHAIGFVTQSKRGVITVASPKANLAVGMLQPFLDRYVETSRGASMDYIHGGDVVESLAAHPERIGLLLPPMDKSDLFKTVLVDGALPRKTFSMGEAEEKRYYLEARRIVAGAR